jgi:hypothetical protein
MSSEIFRLQKTSVKFTEEKCIRLVNLTTTQVETLFGELEYIEPRLKVLGVVGVESTKVQNARAIDNTSYIS